MAFVKKLWLPGRAGGTLIRSVDLNRMEQGIADAHDGSGWVAPTQWFGGWRPYGNGGNNWALNGNVIRKVGSRVQLRGFIDKNGGDWVALESILEIPLGYRPNHDHVFVAEAKGGSGVGETELRINTNGFLHIGERGGNGNPVVWASLAQVGWFID